jgi:hypothetical protein
VLEMLRSADLEGSIGGLLDWTREAKPQRIYVNNYVTSCRMLAINQTSRFTSAVYV